MYDIPYDIRNSIEKLDYFERIRMYNYIQKLQEYEKEVNNRAWITNPPQGSIERKY